MSKSEMEPSEKDKNEGNKNGSDSDFDLDDHTYQDGRTSERTNTRRLEKRELPPGQVSR